MIPKKIHYCWFGGREKPESFQLNLSSWKKYLPDYEIIEWNEENFDVNFCNFSKIATEQKKWAFVADVARIYALHEQGGIYFDTDVEVKNSFDEFLNLQFFIGMETQVLLSTAVIGSESNQEILKNIMQHYILQQNFDLVTNNQIITSILTSKYGFKPKDENTLLGDGIMVFASTYFSLDLPKTFAAHHLLGTWHDDSNRSYKSHLHAVFYTQKFITCPHIKIELNNIINNQKLITESDILDKIPFKNIVKYCLKKIIIFFK